MEAVKYKISIVILYLMATLSAFPQESAADRFIQGNKFFSEGSFDKALEIWLDIYNTGYRSPELAYNIGNAYFKQNDVPGAILFYERALKLKPSDEDINYNLQIARTMVVDRFEEIPELFFIRWYNFVSLSVSTNGWAVISLVSLILCLILISVFLYSGGYRVKVTGFWLAVILFIIFLTSLAFAFRNKELIYDSREAVIFSPQVNGKSSPDSSGTDLFVLHEGTKVSVEDQVGDWYGIRLSDGNKGWIPSNSLKII